VRVLWAAFAVSTFGTCLAVLKPNTTYYQVDNDVEIGATTSAALFGQNLSADIHDSFGVSGGDNSNTSTGFGLKRLA
jgi:hypothetical protein